MSRRPRTHANDRGAEKTYVFFRSSYVPRLQEKWLSVVNFNVENGAVLKVDAVGFGASVFRNRTVLGVDLANNVSVLSDNLLKLLGFANVREGDGRLVVA